MSAQCLEARDAPTAPDVLDACAHCGKSGGDREGEVKLKLKYCTACRLVKYCSVDCQKAHRKGHKKACKQRAAELKGERLHSALTGTQDSKAAMKVCGACERTLPEDSYSRDQRGRRQSSGRCEECVAAGNQLVLMRKGLTRSEENECPICNLLIPLDWKQSMVKVCCMKTVCNGCTLASRKRGMRDCPFCRTPTPTEDSQILAMIKKRVDAGDPVAIYVLGNAYQDGDYGFEKDVARAVKLHERAAEIGYKDAHYSLGVLYAQGIDVEKDTARAIRHYEAAALSGDAAARHNLGCEEFKAKHYDLALQHWMIAAKMGYQDTLKNVQNMFMIGLLTKADYDGVLRGYQSAIEETRSPNRDEASGLGLVKIMSM